MDLIGAPIWIPSEPTSRRTPVPYQKYLGLQDAPRKQKPPVQASGPWAGCVFKTSDTEIKQSVTQSKWDKAKAQIAELSLMMSDSVDDLMDYKRLEQI
jgi:hypothetical protein